MRLHPRTAQPTELLRTMVRSACVNGTRIDPDSPRLCADLGETLCRDFLG